MSEKKSVSRKPGIVQQNHGTGCRGDRKNNMPRFFCYHFSALSSDNSEKRSTNKLRVECGLKMFTNVEGREVI